MEIDKKSFVLGMVTAFGECVANEAKRLAFSPPVFPTYEEELLPEIMQICEEQGLQYYLEKNEDMDEDRRVYWWVLYKFSEELETYLKLRSSGKNPAWDFGDFKELLSYGIIWGEGAENVVPKMRKEARAMDPVTRVLFPNGGWPIEKGSN